MTDWVTDWVVTDWVIIANYLKLSEDPLLLKERASKYNLQAAYETLRYWSQDGTDPVRLKPHMIETFRHFRYMLEQIDMGIIKP